MAPEGAPPAIGQTKINNLTWFPRGQHFSEVCTCNIATINTQLEAITTICLAFQDILQHQYARIYSVLRKCANDVSCNALSKTYKIYLKKTKIES